MDKKIGIIGAGNMGSVFYKGLSKIVDEENLYICDTNQGKLEELGVKNTFADAGEMLKEVDVVILAIKPQSFEEFKKSLKVHLDYKLLISIMAGISVERLEETGAKRIIRAMPNLPVQVKKGVVGWFTSEGIDDTDKEIVKKLFSAFGYAPELTNESMIDAITVLSGSGPAYYFLLAEFLSDKAVSLGFSDEEARKITEATLEGSAELLKKGDKSAREWRYAVTSKGGVTEAVVDSLTEAGFGEIFDKAVEEGIGRSEGLGG